jgi:hypothetical protein
MRFMFLSSERLTAMISRNAAALIVLPVMSVKTISELFGADYHANGILTFVNFCV